MTSLTDISQSTQQLKPAGPGPRPMPAASGGGRGIKPLVSLRSHKRIALISLVATMLIGLPISWLKGQATYYTEAAVYISPRFIKTLSDDEELRFQSNSQYRQFVQQQSKTITRFEILSQVVAQLDSTHKQWPETHNTQLATRWLQSHLQVKLIKDTYLIRVGLEGTSPDGLAETVNAVVSTYLSQQRSENVYASDERVKALQEERSKLLQELGQQSEAQTLLAQELGVTSFNNSVLNPYDQLLVSSRQSLHDTRQQRMQAEASLASLDGTQRPDGDGAAQAAAMAHVFEDASFLSLTANLNQRRSELMAKISALATDHPGRKSIARELAAIGLELKKTSVKTANEYREQILEQLKTEVFQKRLAEEKLDAEVKSLASQASWFAVRYQQARALEVDIERLRQQISSVEERIDFLLIESTAPGFVRVETAALRPELPSGGGRTKMFLLFVGLSIAIAIALPVAIDTLDPRILTPPDLDRTLSFPSLGWLLEREDDLTRDFGRDQLRRMAALLDREHRQQGTRTILLTSVKPGGGTSTLTLDLARELADIGSRTLAISINPLNSDARYGKDGIAQLNLEGIRRYRTEDGWSIWASADRAAGKRLLSELAKPNDLYLRAQDYPGAQVILRREGQEQSPCPRVIQEAAAVAAYWSRGRKESTVAVKQQSIHLVDKEDAPELETLWIEPSIDHVSLEVPMRKRDKGPNNSEAKAPRSTLLQVLENGTPITDAITPSTTDLPDRIALGTISGGRHLSSIHKLNPVIAELHKHYDLILIDGPPLLLSADTELLVRLTDCTLLIVEAGSVNRGEVKRAVRQLEKTDPRLIGGILNRVSVYEGGGYFANMLEEYRSGERSIDPKWKTPWLWK